MKGDEKWYCNKCKEHVVATKRISIYSSPNFLIIHLKRFKHTTGGFFTSANKKINTLITFPVEGLDLSKFVLKGDQSIYDLYAVSNHYGGLKGGHYTAFARNPVVGKWH